MPIYLDRDPPSHSLLAADRWLRGDGSVESPEPAGSCLEIGIVNNMPDRALKAAEHQFIRLLDSVAYGLAVRLMFYSLPDVPRTKWGQHHICSFYSSLDDLWTRRLDGLIVTGTEPHTSKLEQEPYWSNLIRVVEWAERNTCSAIWSCLAAQAAVLHRDGIVRRPLSNKRFGLFQCAVTSDHPLTGGMSCRFPMPHSRWNDLAEPELTACGYRVLTRSENGEADMFTRDGKSLFVYFQGHPEYEAKTLLQEYRRDVGRYLKRESDAFPELPHEYFDRRSVQALTAFRERAVQDRRGHLLGEFPTALAERNLSDPWRPAAVRLYRNWLMHLCARKEQVRKKHQDRSQTQQFVESRHVAAAG